MNIPPDASSNFDITSLASSVGVAQVASPIADLTYRNYDGPLKTRAVRWWIVALAGLRQAFRKPGFWISVVLCALPCLIFGLLLYIQKVSGQMPPRAADADPRFATTFFQVIQIQGLFIFIIALTVGAGCIAADNSANALLVYLSKPLTKSDYLLGKWMAIFLLLFGAIAIPNLLLYVFCLLMFFKDGFLSEEPLLLGRILLAAAVPAILYASLLLGISAWSKTARAVGGIMAVLYFMSLILSGFLVSIFYNVSKEPSDKVLLAASASLSGLISGLIQHIFGVTSRTAGRGMTWGSPPLMPLLIVFTMLVVVGIGAARMKVRAVEVVRG